MGERIKITAKKPLSTKENSAPNKQKTGFRSQSSHVDRILFLQRTIGNQAVQRLIKSGALQAKLMIGQPGDKYEQEADRVADEVMRMQEPEMQRQVEEEEEEEILQTKPLVDQITPLVQRQVEEEEEEEMLQAKSREDSTSGVANDLESQINAIKGGGQPLAESERTFFEPRFGYDFGQVRMHTDTRAAKMAKAVNARAFTTEQDVVFGASMYNPGTTTGKRLLAHELTHVVQQQALQETCRAQGDLGHELTHVVQQNKAGVQHVVAKLIQCDRFSDLLQTGPATLHALNPPDVESGIYCSTNCPATAAAVHHYLQTGQIQQAHCDPVHSTGEYRWVNTTWSQRTESLNQVLGHVSTHGQHIVVEGTRPCPEGVCAGNLTPNHYFVILNIEGTQYIVDAFGSGRITHNINEYVDQNYFDSYRYVTGNFQVAPVYEFEP